MKDGAQVSFDDLYDIVDGVRGNVQQFESLIDRICFGTSFTPIDAKAMNERLSL